jgi:hypothetical protein
MAFFSRRGAALTRWGGAGRVADWPFAQRWSMQARIVVIKTLDAVECCRRAEAGAHVVCDARRRARLAVSWGGCPRRRH